MRYLIGSRNVPIPWAGTPRSSVALSLRRADTDRERILLWSCLGPFEVMSWTE